jgi:acyl-coenzyme a thioesterase 11
MKNLEPKTVAFSRSVSTDLVLPNETNHYGNMFGGELLARMDRVGTIAAVRHSGNVVVTAAVNSVSFNKTIPQGSMVTVEAMVSRAFTSSMEVYIDVWVEDPENGNRVKSNEAIYTFVALNKAEEPVEVPQVIPETSLEIERYQGALRRKQLSLVLAGRLKPHDASELQDFFQDLEHQ